MREIKFRMWNQYSETEGKYIYSTEEVMECLKQQISFDKGLRLGYDHISDGSRFELYTGFKDKNNKRIYEGDVLHIPGYYCTVFYDKGAFKTEYRHPEDGEILLLEDLEPEKFEII